MNAAAMIPFAFDGATIRTVMLDDQPWFVGKDIATALGYVNPRQAIIDHCRMAKPIGGGVTGGHESRPPNALDPQTVIIPEPDLFRLIIRSTLASAERFERWIFEDVLPTLRRTGRYAMPGAEPAQPYAALDAATRRAVNVAAQQLAQQAFRTKQRQLGAVVGRLGLGAAEVERLDLAALERSGVLPAMDGEAADPQGTLDLRSPPLDGYAHRPPRRPPLDPTGAERQRRFRERRRAKQAAAEAAQATPPPEDSP